MKKLLTLTGIASIGMVLVIISASEASAASASEISRKEALLAQSGFKVITVTTPQQKAAVNGLAQGRCSAVMVNLCRFTHHTVMCSTGPLVLARTNRSVISAGARQSGQPTS